MYLVTNCVNEINLQKVLKKNTKPEQNRQQILTFSVVFPPTITITLKNMKKCQQEFKLIYGKNKGSLRVC